MTGYICCFSNELFPTYLKICITKITPEEEVHNMNVCIDSNILPTPYYHVYSICVHKPKKIMKYMKKHLEEPYNGLYQTSIERVKSLILDSVMLHPKTLCNEEDEDTKDSDSEKGINLNDIFRDNQKIRHKIKNSIWKAVYDEELNQIVCYKKNGLPFEEEYYTSLSDFAMEHHRHENPSRKTANGWVECECKKNKKWVIADKVRSKK